MSEKSVWVVDDDASIAWVLEKALSKQGYDVKMFNGVRSILAALKTAKPDLVISDIKMPGVDGLKLLELLNENFPMIPVIIMTAYSDLETTISSYKKGAFEYLSKPFDINDALALVARALPVEEIAESTPKRATRPRDNESEPTDDIKTNPEIALGHSAPMQAVFKLIGRIAQSSLNTIILGESGTGKALIARAVHDSSPRKDQPFVTLNTASMPIDSLESELFGYEVGAFKGALGQKIGRLEQANGGTLFLNEVADMSAELQANVVRVLSEKCFYRLGGQTQIDIDIRIIATSSHDLEQRVQSGAFRLDLFHRLNIVTIHLPSLSERLDDLPALLDHFLKRAAETLKLEVKTLSDSAQTLLMNYAWPGNVRELDNLCQRLTVMSASHVIKPEDLGAEFTNIALKTGAGESHQWQREFERRINALLIAGNQDVSRALQNQVDEIMIQSALKHTGGHKQKAAKALGWGRNTLTRKMHDLDL